MRPSSESSILFESITEDVFTNQKQAMKIKRFRVQKFKCVVDSGWVDVDELTVLVGKNEAGKTSLLRALHQLNPFKPEPYSIARDWPRGHRGERADSQVVCSAEFELDAEETVRLKEITGGQLDLQKFVVTRDYAGRFTVRFPDSIPQTALAWDGAVLESPGQLKAEPSTLAKAREYIVSVLPTFVYMDEYQTFRGTASLDQVKLRQEQGKLTEDDETLITMLSLAGLDVERELARASDQDREERQYALSDAAATLNRKLESHWKQRRYEVEFRADGQQFMTFVRDTRDKSLIRLEERSKGFQWFFSFDLMLMHETKGSLKDCVILLDEPGLHLHPAAQMDLLERLKKYARSNTVIYTTHLPFMIELQNPERIRVISETDHGTVVKESLSETQPEAKLVLQAALGFSGRISHCVADQNIVVKDLDDYWILTALSDLFNRSGRLALPPDVLLTPAGGAAQVTNIATLMVGQNLQVLALYDTDHGGRIAQEKFQKGWLPRYQDKKGAALSLGPAVGSTMKEFSIEDLFADVFYLSCVELVYGKQLAAAGLDLKSLPKAERLVKRVEMFFESASLKFEKRPVCKAICGKVRAMRSVSELPGPTFKASEMLFNEINRLIADR
jgi:energy-coupling factor transporter ATP-binding protein EcfA2